MRIRSGLVSRMQHRQANAPHKHEANEIVVLPCGTEVFDDFHSAILVCGTDCQINYKCASRLEPSPAQHQVISTNPHLPSSTIKRKEHIATDKHQPYLIREQANQPSLDFPVRLQSEHRIRNPAIQRWEYLLQLQGLDKACGR